MPWWAIVYLVLFALLCTAAIWDDDRDGRSLQFLLCAVLSHSAIVYLFIAFWHPDLVAELGMAAGCVFVLAIAWQIFQTVQDLQVTRADPDLSSAERRTIPPLAVALVWLFDLPAFVISGIAAFRAWVPPV